MAIDTAAINTQDQQFAGATKELIYMNHVLNTLTRAQASFDTIDKTSVSRFSLYMAYLSNICLDDETQALIDKEVDIEATKLKELYGSIDSFESQLRLGMVVCKYVMRYLHSVMELNHVDISGPVSNEIDIENLNAYDGSDLMED